ncbi:MAG: GNAT family N-acetyltransferase [Microbacterium sp.]|uniref:GNAT family N-acetyltransferase n=1 Tax=Microbacterium sp. TaxID=51671 RepID=UPI0039E3A107
MSVLVRPAGDGDHDDVDRIVREAYDHDYGRRDRGADPFRLSVNRALITDVWLAVDPGTEAQLGNVTVSKVGGEPMMEDTRPDELDFRLLAVAPSARRRGIGELLTRHVIELARARGLRGVFMKSGPQMRGAHALYEKIGFRREPDRDGLIRNGVTQFDLYAFAVDVVDIDPARYEYLKGRR